MYEELLKRLGIYSEFGGGPWPYADFILAAAAIRAQAETIKRLRDDLVAANAREDEAWNAAVEASAQAAYQWWDADDAQELREHIRALKKVKL
jgi:hypothetical protein